MRFSGRGVALVLLFVVLLVATSPVRADAFPDGTIGGGIGVATKPERTSQDDLDRLSAAGFRYVRFDMRWREVEREKGVYDWTLFDRFLEDVRARKLKSVIILHGGNPVHTGVVELDPSKAFGYRSAPAAPTKATAVKAFVDFATAAVKRYGTADIVWELWNEPDIAPFWPPEPNAQAFAALASATCAAIRKAAPDARIVGPSLARLPDLRDLVWKGFLETFLASSAASCIDALSLHPYRWQRPPETVAADYLHKVRPFIAAHAPSGRKQMPLVNTEWGYTTTHATEEQQAAYVLRAHLVNMLNGVPLNIWYQWKDSRLGENDPEAHFGLLDYRGGTKPAIEAVESLLPDIRDATLERRLPLPDPDIYAVLIRQPDGRRQILAWVGRATDTGSVELTVQDGGETRRFPLGLRPRLIDPVGENPILTLREPPP